MKSLGLLIALAITMTASYLLAEQPGSSLPATTFQSGEQRNSLIELFTSEGCSSCPPAEKWMSALKANSDLWKKVVPVAFHVDYWDHLGWRDRFAKTQFTERQQKYAAVWGGDSIYTPGFVLNGREWRNWFGGPTWQNPAEKVGRLQVVLNDRVNLTAEFAPENAQARALTLNVALLGNDLQSDVARGENAGRKLRHDFVVLDLASITMAQATNNWTASSTLPREVNGVQPTALAAWVTSGETNAPIQATGGWLTPNK